MCNELAIQKLKNDLSFFSLVQKALESEGWWECRRNHARCREETNGIMSTGMMCQFVSFVQVQSFHCVYCGDSFLELIGTVVNTS